MNATKQALAFAPDYAVPPGKLLEEYLRTRKMSARELARRCGRSPKLITEIILGKAPIEPETALQLESVLAVDASIWLGFETEYRLQLARLGRDRRLAEHIGWAKLFPIKALQERGLIPSVPSGTERVRALLRFFGVGSVDACKARCRELVDADFRTSPTYTSHFEPLAAWLRAGEIRASQVDTKSYDRSAFIRALAKLRPLTRCRVADAHPEIVKHCAEAGVAFVLEPAFEKVTASGVSRWLAPDRALIQQSGRYRSDDHFWFTLYHEAAHLLLHSRKSLYIDGQKGGNADPKHELEANEWAAEFLIPQAALVRFLTRFKEQRSEEAVISFAAEHGVSPGIVVGQLQHRGAIGYNQMNGLRARFDHCDLSVSL